jgi:hypothetical protein
MNGKSRLTRGPDSGVDTEDLEFWDDLLWRRRPWRPSSITRMFGRGGNQYQNER